MEEVEWSVKISADSEPCQERTWVAQLPFAYTVSYLTLRLMNQIYRSRIHMFLDITLCGRAIPKKREREREREIERERKREGERERKRESSLHLTLHNQVYGKAYTWFSR